MFPTGQQTLRPGGSGPPRSMSFDSTSPVLAGGAARSARVSPSADNLPSFGRRSSAKGSMLEEGNPNEQVLKHEHPWTIKDIGQNAISGILNDPGVQNKSIIKPIKGFDSLPPVPPTAVRKVRDQEFDQYRRSLAEVFDKFQYNRAVGLAAALEGTPILALRDQKANSLADLVEYTDKFGLTDLAHYSHASKPNRKGLTQTQRTRILSVNAPPLNTVPSVFFDLNFDLANPHTFDTVCENSDITSPSNADAVAVNTALQEKVSNYLDTVEVHLIKEISRRSTSFFSALSNLQALHKETHDCVTQIQALRQNLASVSESGPRKGLEVVRMKRRRGNLGMMYGALKLVAEVKQTQPMIQVLLNQGDYVAALDLIEEATLMLRGRPPDDEEGDSKPEALANGILITRRKSVVPRSLDLRGVKSLGNLTSQLSEMSRLIGKMIDNEIFGVVLGDIRAVISQMESSQTRIAPKIQNSPVAVWIRNILNGTYTVHSGTGTPQVAGPVLGPIQEENLRSRLIPLVFGLLRMDRLSMTLQAYKDVLTSEIKAVTRKLYPAALLSNDGQITSPGSVQRKKLEAQTARARQLRTMSFDSFFNLMISVYVSILHILHRVAVIHELQCEIIKLSVERGIIIGGKVVDFAAMQKDADEPESRLKPKKLDEDDDLGSLDILGVPDDETLRSSMARSPTSAQSPSLLSMSDAVGGRSTVAQMIQDSAEIVFAVSDFSHVRCAKLVGVRSEQNAQLNPKDFFRLFGATWEFVVAGEAIAGRMCFGLKGTMLSQAKAFLTHFHEEKTKQMALLIENEQWVQTEVPIDFQKIGQTIVNAGRPTLLNSPPGVRDSYDDIMSPAGSEENLDEGESDLSTGGFAGNEFDRSPMKKHLPPGVNEGKSLKYLVLDGEKFYVVNSVLMFLKMLADYLQCVEYIPALTTDVLNRLVELLKLFNSRTCQVILGAGAMRSAGLKNITARHIALAAQALSVVVIIIPHIRGAIQRHLSAKQQVLLGDFDRLSRDFKDHQSELYTKLVSIMNERLNVHCRSLQATNWEAPAPKDASHDDASPYMVLLVKETATLHKVLSKYLTPPTLKSIMSNVFKAYNERLEQEIKRVELYSSSSKVRLLIDVQYFIQKLSSLENIDGPGNHLEVVVNNMKIRDKRERLASAPVTSSTGTPGQPYAGPAAHGLQRVASNPNNILNGTANSASARPTSLDGGYGQFQGQTGGNMFKGFNFSSSGSSAGRGTSVGANNPPPSSNAGGVVGATKYMSLGEKLRAQNRASMDYGGSKPNSSEEERQ
ncbi:Vps54-like protein-domain-containing protein [Cladochytrium replicatum]|nr:Vps54-like protein-domain-containing protein [Cladochytrium replicatum]